MGHVWDPRLFHSQSLFQLAQFLLVPRDQLAQILAAGNECLLLFGRASLRNPCGQLLLLMPHAVPVRDEPPPLFGQPNDEPDVGNRTTAATVLLDGASVLANELEIK